jgi:hypothetical protein
MTPHFSQALYQYILEMTIWLALDYTQSNVKTATELGFAKNGLCNWTHRLSFAQICRWRRKLFPRYISTSARHVTQSVNTNGRTKTQKKPDCLAVYFIAISGLKKDIAIAVSFFMHHASYQAVIRKHLYNIGGRLRQYG